MSKMSCHTVSAASEFVNPLAPRFVKLLSCFHFEPRRAKQNGDKQRPFRNSGVSGV